MKDDTEKLSEIIMKNSDKVAWVLLILGIVFIGALFYENFTATAIGLVMLGCGVSLLLYDKKTKSKATWYIWLAIIIIILFLLGYGDAIPKLSFG